MSHFGITQPEEWPEDDWAYDSAPRCRCRHNTSDPERGCECGYAEWKTEHAMAERDEAERIAEMFGAQIAVAWRTIETCAFKDPEDGTCSHPDNPTPECHGAICPLVPRG
jgi:hypothetical protein